MNRGALNIEHSQTGILRRVPAVTSQMIVNAQSIPKPPRGSFWVFAYGSLMWHPGFDYTSCRQARLFGYRRTLCILSYVYRGTRDFPGMVFGLDAGGSCVGRVFRVDTKRRLETYAYLMEREMVRGVYKPCWIPAGTPLGRVTALCFVADRSHEQYAPSLTERDLVSRIKRARGRSGSNIDYIVNTCRHLEDLGIRSRGLARIRDRVTGSDRALRSW